MHGGPTDNSFGNLQVFTFRFGNRGIAFQTAEYEYDLLTSLSAASVCVSIHSDFIVHRITPMLTKLLTVHFARRLHLVHGSFEIMFNMKYLKSLVLPAIMAVGLNFGFSDCSMTVESD